MFLLALLTRTAGAFAQGNIPFPEPGAAWHVTEVLPILGPNDAYARWMYRTTGDSLSVNDTVYHTVSARGTCFSDATTGYQYAPYQPAEYAVVGGLRHADGRIWFRRFPTPHFQGMPPSLGQYPTDHDVLICDFNLLPGDTLTYFNGAKYLVEKTETSPEGRKRITLSFKDCGFPGIVVWEQGRGPLRGLLESISLCFHIGSCYRSEVPPYDDVGCPLPCTPGEAVLVATEENVPHGEIAVWPNPAQDHVLIRLPDDGYWHLRLYDLMGRILRSVDAPPGIARIDLSGIPSGASLLEVRGAGGRLGSWQFLLIN